MAKSTGGQTIVVAGGGGAGAGGSRGGGGTNGDGKPKTGGGGGGKFKLDDQSFWSIVMALGLVGGAAYIYSTRPDLVNEFVGTITGNRAPQVPAVPAQPSGTVQNDVLPQQTTGMEDPYAQQNYPLGPGTGQEQFQYPQQQQSMNLQQYQPYQPDNYGGMGSGGNFQQQSIQTSWNPAFGQNSNQPTQSFAARRLTQLEFDSSDGMLTAV